MSNQAIHSRTRHSRGWRTAGWGTAIALLVLPAIAMQFTNEELWTASDFVVFGAMLLTAGLLIELAVRSVGSTRGRLASIALVLLGFLLIWAELAVGLFD